MKLYVLTTADKRNHLYYERAYTDRRMAEYELIVSVAGARVMISPWCGAKDPNKSSIFIVGDDPFGWVSFAEYHIERQLWASEAKVDIYDQLMWRWDDLVDYCWKVDLSSE